VIKIKVCVICFNLKEENLRKQPWRYIFEICRGCMEHGIDTVLITNGDQRTKYVERIRIRTVKKLQSFFQDHQDVLNIIKEENPDVVIKLLGTTNFLSLKCKIDKPLIGILTSPLYTFREVMNVGFKELFHHFKYLYVHIIGSLIPRFFIRRSGNFFDYIVVLSNTNRRKLLDLKIKTNVIVIPPGIDEYFFEKVDEDKKYEILKQINPENVPIILYFASPLTLRGTDTLVKSFASVRKKFSCKLLILSRQDDKESNNEVKYLIKIASRLNVSDSFVVINDLLTPTEINNYLSIANIICLPFKIVFSDVPLTIIEAMASGKTVISTNIASIPEILDKYGLIIKPNNEYELRDMIIKALNNKNKIRLTSDQIIKQYPHWKDFRENFIEFILKDVAKK